MKTLLASLFASALALVAPAGVLAQTYPQRPITMIVPFPPGGASDVLARLIGEKLSVQVGQPVLVENRAGGGTTIGTSAVANSAPTGYTLLLTNNSLAVNATLVRKLNYDTRALVPVAYIGEQANVLVVNKQVAAKSAADLADLARKSPGKVNIGSGGNGGSSHLALELFKMRTHTDIVHVPFQGGAPALAAVMGGTVDGYFDTVSSSAPQVHAGKVRALGVTTRERSKLLPEVPTLMEQGIPDYDASNWNAVFAPPGTPRPVVTFLNEKINKILAMPDVREKLASFGISSYPAGPEFLARHLEREIDRWGEVIRAGAIEIQ